MEFELSVEVLNSNHAHEYGVCHLIVEDGQRFGREKGSNIIMLGLNVTHFEGNTQANILLSYPLPDDPSGTITPLPDHDSAKDMLENAWQQLKTPIFTALEWSRKASADFPQFVTTISNQGKIVEKVCIITLEGEVTFNLSDDLEEVHARYLSVLNN